MHKLRNNYCEHKNFAVIFQVFSLCLSVWHFLCVNWKFAGKTGLWNPVANDKCCSVSGFTSLTIFPPLSHAFHSTCARKEKLLAVRHKSSVLQRQLRCSPVRHVGAMLLCPKDATISHPWHLSPLWRNMWMKDGRVLEVIQELEEGDTLRKAQISERARESRWAEHSRRICKTHPRVWAGSLACQVWLICVSCQWSEMCSCWNPCRRGRKTVDRGEQKSTFWKWRISKMSFLHCLSCILEDLTG